ncbi:hypothetical protein GGS24DRAFT_469217 [Hypoxylon argillaceum]|nr:hypothetical protein GGS24DRAFT_469217 [Hypoxylon argillaceum]
MPDTPSTLAPSSSLEEGACSPKKTSGLGPRQSSSSARGMNTYTLNYRPLGTPSTRALSGSLNGIYPLRPRLSGEAGETAPKKTYMNVGISQENTAPTAGATAIVTTSLDPALLRNPRPILPPTFPPAVKARIYSNVSRGGSQRKMDTGSKNLDTFGFTSTALPVARTGSTSQPDMATTVFAPPASTCQPKPIPIPKPTTKRIKQETQEPPQPRTATLPLLPRTPERPATTKRAHTWTTPSTGTYADPYTLSSDSESDDDANDNSNKETYNLPPLGSFTNILDMHETASDVEAVLDQFPAWLSSPSTPELRSSYLTASSPSRPIIAPRPSARPRNMEGENRDKERRESRRVRFGEGDGFSPSPVPQKRATPAIQGSIPPTRRISVLGKSSSPRTEQKSSSVERITAVALDSSEYINRNFDHDHGHDRSTQHKKDVQSRKKKRRRPHEKKSASRHRNQNREAWRRNKALKAKKGLS